MKGTIMAKKKDELIKLMQENISKDRERLVTFFGHATDYTVNRDGDVISYKGIATDSPRVLKQMTVNGYKKVNLMVDEHEYLVSVHRLVARAFIPNPDNKPDVNHLDGDKGNNHDWNLEWATKSENIRHAIRTGLKKGNQGEQHHGARITEKTAKKICELIESGRYSYSEIAEMTESSYSIVKKIKNGVRWRHVSYKYNLSNYKKNIE